MRERRAILFDLDGTLTESKAPLAPEMAALLRRLLGHVPVAVIGGGRYTQFEKQFLAHFPCDDSCYTNLLILPLSGSSMYRFTNGSWREIYRNEFALHEKERIRDAFTKALHDIGYVPPERTYGEIIEDRGGQLTFSAVGQEAPLEAKRAWNTVHDVRPALVQALRGYLPEFEVRSGGLTSVDVTKQGIDKAYGIQQVSRMLDIPEEDMCYVGDALYPGGNDEAALRTNVEATPVTGVAETKTFIETLLRSERSRAGQAS